MDHARIQKNSQFKAHNNSIMASNTSSIKIVNDPRFKLARNLLSSGDGNGGPDAAIDIFATLLEECRTSLGETSLDAALCQYEYGNALFRAVIRHSPSGEEESEQQEKQKKQHEQSTYTDKKPAAVKKNEAAENQREIMAAAAEKRTIGDTDDSSRLSNKKSKIEDDHSNELVPNISDHVKVNDSYVKEEENNDTINSASEEDDTEEEEDDVDLALDMMETSFSIFESHNTKNNAGDGKITNNKEQKQWLSNQLPRVLIGIGDLHSFRAEFGNAVDAYCRALPFREEAWKKLKQSLSDDEMLTLEHLQCQRHLVETYALVSEALMTCPEGEDVVCQYDDDENDEQVVDEKNPAAAVKKIAEKGGSILVKAGERVNFAQSHYELAREGLEEIGKYNSYFTCVFPPFILYVPSCHAYPLHHSLSLPNGQNGSCQNRTGK